jgi:tRNA(Ile)-lysidine synthase
MDFQRLEQILEKECLLNRAEPILVGVSGGPDSLCLMHGLARLRFSLLVVHFDHRLRPESGSDAAFVEVEARRLGLPFLSGSQDVAGFAASQRMSIEEAARVLRYRFLFAQARQHGAQAVAVGHTADDQVETVLLHILRGAGLSGLQGMAYRSIHPDWDERIPLVRPLLSFWRDETTACCSELDLTPLYDPSNQNPAFLRNRLRHELIPYLETYNPQVRRAVWRMSQVLAGDEAVVGLAAAQALQNCLVSRSDTQVKLNIAQLAQMEPGLLRAVLRAAINALLPSLRNVDYSAIERVERFVGAPHAGQVDLVKGLRGFAEAGNLVLQKSDQLGSELSWPSIALSAEIPVPIPGEVDLPLGWRMSTRWVDSADFPVFEAAGAGRSWEAWLDAGQLDAPIFLRPMRPGDRFQPLGLHGHSQKLSDFWINEKLPRRARTTWPLLVCADQILWIPGFRPAEPQRLQKNTRKALYVRLFRVDGSG